MVLIPRRNSSSELFYFIVLNITLFFFYILLYWIGIKRKMTMKRNNLDILFKQYYERLVLFAESYVGDMMIAEDMVQDVF